MADDAKNKPGTIVWRDLTVPDAEAVRDSTLYVSGRLDLTMGGPSAEQFFFKDDHSPIYEYAGFDFDSPAARRRRPLRATNKQTTAAAKSGGASSGAAWSSRACTSPWAART